MNYVTGIDTSVYEGLMNVDKTLQSDAKFIIPKAGEAGYVDKQFLNTWNNYKGKLVRSAFWFLSINYSIKGQAQKFAELLKSDTGEMEPYVDYEQIRQFWALKNPVTGKRGWNHLDFSHLSGFISYFEIEVSKYFTKWPWPNKLGIYTGYSYWNEFGTKDPAYSQRPLWIAEPDPVIQPPALAPWSLGQWKLWQYTFAGDGIYYGTDPLQAKGIDVNKYNGDITKFNAEYSHGAISDSYTLSLSGTKTGSVSFTNWDEYTAKADQLRNEAR